MATNYDIALTNNDLFFSRDGDFLVAESDRQHIIDSINAFPGWWKENPLDGVGLMAYTKASASVQQLSRKIKIELEADGYKVENPEVYFDEAGQLIVNPNAKKT